MLAQAFAAWLMTVATSRGVGEGISCLPPWKHKHCVEKKALALHCSSPHFNPHAKHSATTWMTNHEEMQPGASASRGVSSSWGHRAASCSALGLTSPRILKKVFPLGIFTNANISSLFAICIFFRRKVYLTFFFFLCSPALLLHISGHQPEESERWEQGWLLHSGASTWILQSSAKTCCYRSPFWKIHKTKP